MVVVLIALAVPSDFLVSYNLIELLNRSKGCVGVPKNYRGRGSLGVCRMYKQDWVQALPAVVWPQIESE